MFELRVVTGFAAAHRLTMVGEKCENLHGHNWKVETEVEATALDDMGMGVDFKTMKAAANEVGDRLDHHYLNDIAPFDSINPTAENIAAYMYREIGAILNSETVKVKAVTLWETERACIRYSEDD